MNKAPRRINGKPFHVDMEQKKYSVEQFKMNFVKPTIDRECVTRFS